MGVLWGKIGEGVVRYWPPTNSFFLLGVLTSVPVLVKIDQEMRPWECSQTDRYTHWQTDPNRFYNLSHAICYSYGTDKKRRTIAPGPSRDIWGRWRSEGERWGGKVSCQTVWRREHRHNYRCVKRVDNSKRRNRPSRPCERSLYRLQLVKFTPQSIARLLCSSYKGRPANCSDAETRAGSRRLIGTFNRTFTPPPL